ncbi:hypothetical protein [Cylindrospermum stagnale]|uniref:hypothetical protein n=1 Tax=Cylindrospermum stagnale TaxID=142864 RepID=UPI0012F6C26E|nr:hypothetical protein [Cylindrospermum stagnale]
MEASNFWKNLSSLDEWKSRLHRKKPSFLSERDAIAVFKSFESTQTNLLRVAAITRVLRYSRS